MTYLRKVLRAAVILATIAIGAWVIKAATHSAAHIRWDLMDPWFIIAALLTSAGQECAGTVSAQMALVAFRQRAAFTRLLVITTVATATNSVVPVPAGIPTRIWLQKTWLGIPMSCSTAAIALEMLCGYGMLVLFALAGTFWFGANVLALGLRYLPIFGAVAALALSIAWLLRRSLQNRIRQLVALRPTLLPTLGTIGLSVLVIALATLRLWLILHALDDDAASIVQITAALCIARVAGVASMIPMGLGSRDVTLTGLLVLSGIALPIAVLAAAVDRVLSTAPYLAVALIGWPLLHRSGAIKHSGDAAH